LHAANREEPETKREQPARKPVVQREVLRSVRQRVRDGFGLVEAGGKVVDLGTER